MEVSEVSSSARLVRNTVFNACGKFVSFAAVLLLTPMIYGRLGPERFGLWALVTLFAGQFGLLDLGFSAVLTKYVAEFQATGDLERVNSPLTAALVAYTAISALALLLLWVFRAQIFTFFSVPQSFWNQSKYLIPSMVIIFLLTSILSLLQAMINGLQEMAITGGSAILQGLVSVVTTITLIRRDWDLAGVIVGAIAGLGAAIVVLSIFVVRLFPNLRLNAFYRDPDLGRVLRFGATVQLARVSGVAVAYSDRVLIGHFLGLIWLAKYQLGYTIVSAMRGVVLLIPAAVMPATSNLAAENHTLTLDKLYLRGTKYILLVTLAITSVIICLAPQITQAWLKQGDSSVILIIRLLTAGQLLHVLTGLGTTMCEGLGEAGMEAKFGFSLAVLQLGLGIVAIWLFGLIGILCSTMLVTAVTSILFLNKFHKLMGSKFPWLQLLQKPVAASALASGLILLLPGLMVPFLGYAGVMPGPLLSLQLAIFFSAYTLIVVKSGYLDAFDLSLATRLSRPSFWNLFSRFGR